MSRPLSYSGVHSRVRTVHSATLPVGEPMSASSTLIRKTNVHIDGALTDIKRRFEEESRIVQQNYEVEYKNYTGLAKTVEELELIVEEERRRILELEAKLNAAVTDLEKERRLNDALTHENADLKEELRQSHAIIADCESKIARLQQDNVRLDSENKHLNSEIRRLTEQFNARIADLEAKHQAEKRDLMGEIQRLRDQLEAQRVDYENRLRELERDYSIRISRLEEKLRERERLIVEFEQELKRMTDHIARLKAEYEEEIRRQVAHARQEEQQNAAVIINDLKAALAQSEKERNAAARKNLELARELQFRERQLADLRAQLEAELLRLKDENNELRNQINTLKAANEQLYADNAAKDHKIHALENDNVRLQRELETIKTNYTNEIARLVNEQNAERRRWEELDRHNKAQIAELERVLRTVEAENERMRADLERIKEQVTGNVNRTIFQTFSQYDSVSPTKFYA